MRAVCASPVASELGLLGWPMPVTCLQASLAFTLTLALLTDLVTLATLLTLLRGGAGTHGQHVSTGRNCSNSSHSHFPDGKVCVLHMTRKQLQPVLVYDSLLCESTAPCPCVLRLRLNSMLHPGCHSMVCPALFYYYYTPLCLFLPCNAMQSCPGPATALRLNP